MGVALKLHHEAQAAYGEYYKDTRPDLWNRYAIDEPDYDGDTMHWCPLYVEVSG